MTPFKLITLLMLLPVCLVKGQAKPKKLPNSMDSPFDIHIETENESIAELGVMKDSKGKYYLDFMSVWYQFKIVKGKFVFNAPYKVTYDLKKQTVTVLDTQKCISKTVRYTKPVVNLTNLKNS